MGRGSHQSAALPSRPKFTWDAKNPPWTDGKGDQEDHYNAVRRWNLFHETLPDNNSNKIPSNLLALCFHSQLFGRAKDLCSAITDEELIGNDAIDALPSCIYKRDPLSVISEGFRSFSALLKTRRSTSESLKNFESRFSAQVTRFNAISKTTKLPECITSQLLLENAEVSDTQRVTVLAAAVPTDSSLGSSLTNDQFLQAVTYQAVSALVKQCDANYTAASSVNSLHASTAHPARHYSNRQRDHRQDKPPFRLLPKADQERIMMKSPCDLCGKRGHWKRHHNPDGSLPEGVKSVGYTAGASTSTAKNKFDPSQRKAISFNMATVSALSAEAEDGSDHSFSVGPLVDDGAPYSALGVVELKIISELIGKGESSTLDPIYAALNGCKYWQYGSGEHASARRRILGSIQLTALSDSDRCINIGNLVLEGSSQWVLGRNITRKANINHIKKNAIIFPVDDGSYDLLSMTDCNMLSYVLLERFMAAEKNSSVLSALGATASTHRPWSEIEAIVRRVHNHVCGHANYRDLNLPLERNGLWNEEIAAYVQKLVTDCPSCRSTAPPQPNRKVYISSLTKDLNEIVCIDQFYLDNTRLLHSMDMVTRYSTAAIVRTANLDDAIATLSDGIDDMLTASHTNDDTTPTTPAHAISFEGDEDSEIGNFEIGNAYIIPSLGDRVAIYWPDDSQHYPGTVSSVNDNGKLTIDYDDGDQECLDLSEENWKFVTTSASSSRALSLDASKIEKELLDEMIQYFGHKAFMRHHAQGFDQSLMAGAYQNEEQSFLQTARILPKQHAPIDANIIGSHTIYKVKTNDDGTLKLKTRIALQRNEDNMRESLSKDCAMCPPTGVRILQSIASLKGCTIHKADVTAAFLQTGEAASDFYVRPPRESKMRSSHLWLLLTAAYGLVNANAKWQFQSDAAVSDFGPKPSKHMPQLLYQRENDELILVVAKAVYDLMVAGKGDKASIFLADINRKFKLGTVNNGPGRLRVFGINTVQNDDNTIATNAEDKMEAVAEYPITRGRRKVSEEPLNDIKKSMFKYVNSTIGWLDSRKIQPCRRSD